jgi:hypothetical protein
MKTRHEPLALLINIGTAVAAAFVLVACFGKGMASPPSRVIEKFANFENIRLPIGARTEQELKSFIIRMKGEVDDFGRVYVNNSQVTSTDDPARPFRHITWKVKKMRDDYVARFVVNRASPTNPEVDVRKWLRKGVNWIMVELENTRWGACSMTVERGGPVCLNRFSASISGAPAVVRLPGGGAAG